MHKRAKARYRDKVKPSSTARYRVAISKSSFVRWYEQQPDCCAYCGLTFTELKRLKIKRQGGYCVGWDIDRVVSSRPYELGNLALSCFVCNMAKGDVLSASEGRIIGRAVRKLWNTRLLKRSRIRKAVTKPRKRM
jgi:5-methylcytosine-specific restriction endonuclease McrA